MKDENLSLKYKNILKIGLILITYIFLLIQLPKLGIFLDKVNTILTPFIVGFVIAYLINPIILTVKKLYLKYFNKKCPNALAMLVSYIFALLLLSFLCVSVFPQIWESINVIVTEIPTAVENGYKWVETEGVVYLSELTKTSIDMDDLLTMFNINLEGIASSMTGSIGALLNITGSVFSFIFNIILGFLISIYMLMHKDMYRGQLKKSVFAFMSDEKANDFLNFWTSVHNTFSRFLVARIIDSTIIGIICYISCIFLGFQNSLLISFIVGVTNVIPYFGPFIGAVPSALIVLLQSPMDMLIFIIFIVILQQFDGNILGPKLLGDSLGLTSLWIIFAVAITTGLIGVIGMVIGVPLFAVVYMLFKDLIYDKLEKKGKSTNTKDYIDDLENIDIVKDKEEN